MSMEKSCKDKANEILLRQMQKIEEETDEWPRGTDGRVLANMLAILANAIQYPAVDYSGMLYGLGKSVVPAAEEPEAEA